MQYEKVKLMLKFVCKTFLSMYH